MRVPTISVIIPAYNVSSYVEEALESLASQEELPDEVIIVDDGSADDTLDRVRRFPHPYPVTILAISNQGQGVARNLGLSLCSCDYVYFFDSDDLLECNFIRDMKRIMVAHYMPDIIFFSGRCFYDGVSEEIFSQDYKRGFSGEFESSLDLLNAFHESGKFSSSPCLYVSKRSLWIESSLYFIEYYHEDEHILYPLVLSATSYYVTDESYFMRRVRYNSTMTQAKNEKHVLGARSTVLSLLALNGSIADRGVRRLICDRALFFLKIYFCLSRRVGVGLDKKLIWLALVNLKSARVLLCALYYFGNGRSRHLVKKIVAVGFRAESSR